MSSCWRVDSETEKVFLANQTNQRQISFILAPSRGGAWVRGSGERLHGMQEVTGSIPVFSTNQEQNEHRTTIQMVGNVFVLFCEVPNVTLTWKKRNFDFEVEIALYNLKWKNIVSF